MNFTNTHVSGDLGEEGVALGTVSSRWVCWQQRSRRRGGWEGQSAEHGTVRKSQGEGRVSRSWAIPWSTPSSVSTLQVRGPEGTLGGCSVQCWGPLVVQRALPRLDPETCTV